MSALIECPEHAGAYNCTPFCPRCRGGQEYETTSTPPPVLAEAWIIGDYDVTDIVCEDHAREYASDRALVWEYPGSTLESDHGYAYAVPFSGDLESDYPHTCTAYTDTDICGTYLDTALTSDGVDYVRDNYPRHWWHLWGVEA